MTTHRCPEHIVRLFDTESEAQKGKARMRAINWLQQHLHAVRDGDRVLMPNPITGAMEEWSKDAIKN